MTHFNNASDSYEAIHAIDANAPIHAASANGVHVRAFAMADWEDVASLFLAPRCQRGTLQLPYQSRDDIRKKLENPPPDMHRLVAELPHEKRVVGMIGLHTNKGRRAHAGGIGMFVHDDYQNLGIGGRLLRATIELAEQWLNLHRIELTVFVDNEQAIHLYEKHGFVQEGRLRDFSFRDGAFVDAYTMARIRGR